MQHWKLARIRALLATVIAVSTLVATQPSASARPSREVDSSLATGGGGLVASQDAPLGAVRIPPGRGVGGATFSVSANGLESGQTVEWQWQTWDGSYSTNPTSE